MFITFVDENPASKKIPWANTAILTLNIVICYKTLGRPDFTEILSHYGFIPARHLGIGFLTGPFLHSSWTQLVANMTFLFMFGKGVEEMMGRAKYLGAFSLCTFAGEVAHLYFHPHSVLPLIGASRAVTGLGILYLLLYPWGRMKWIFSFFGAPIIEIPSRTMFVMGLWAGVQAALAFIPWSKLTWLISYLSRLGGSVFTVNPTAGIAWDAHLGALVMGAVFFLVVPRRKKKR
ncbi:MAG TPA: rhomboid family intramembrane serine protease [bacterium]